jgi:hypothetical protein
LLFSPIFIRQMNSQSDTHSPSHQFHLLFAPKHSLQAFEPRSKSRVTPANYWQQLIITVRSGRHQRLKLIPQEVVMKRLVKALLPVLVPLLLIAACSKNNPVAPGETAASQGKLSFAMDVSGNPADNVVSGKVTITKDTLTQTQAVTLANHTGTITFSSIPVGTWFISVQLFDAQGAEIYSGTGSATVGKDQTSIVTIRVNQNTGNLQIIIDTDSNTSPSMVLWNKLGSAEEVLNSAFGPNLSFYTGGSGQNQAGVPDFAPGVFGNCLTLGNANYQVSNAYHNVVVNNLPNLINAEHGTVECWYKQNADSVIYSCGVHRIFDGDWGLGSGINLDEHCLWPNQIRFSLVFGANQVAIYSTNISQYNGSWIHVAAVWNRRGIAGTADTMRLYINGAVTASTTQSNWGTVVGPAADICGGMDNNNAHVFFVDNLKIWSNSKTDFSDRNQE